jgi:hypothetical protein
MSPIFLCVCVYAASCYLMQCALNICSTARMPACALLSHAMPFLYELHLPRPLDELHGWSCPPCMVRLSQGFLKEAPCHDDAWGNEGIYSSTLPLDECEWSASCFCCFTFRETTATTHCLRGWVGPRTSLHITENRRISCPYWESYLGPLVVQPIA